MHLKTYYERFIMAVQTIFIRYKNNMFVFESL